MSIGSRPLIFITFSDVCAGRKHMYLANSNKAVIFYPLFICVFLLPAQARSKYDNHFILKKDRNILSINIC